jgi:hypothetical protein
VELDRKRDKKERASELNECSFLSIYTPTTKSVSFSIYQQFRKPTFVYSGFTINSKMYLYIFADFFFLLWTGALVASYPFDNTPNSIFSSVLSTPSLTPDDDVFKHLAGTFSFNHGRCVGNDTFKSRRYLFFP